jgi:hypothetical protein
MNYNAPVGYCFLLGAYSRSNRNPTPRTVVM